MIKATHPELSGIVLSLVDMKGAPQIYGLDLPVGLVVLSECQTALGRGSEAKG